MNYKEQLAPLGIFSGVRASDKVVQFMPFSVINSLQYTTLDGIPHLYVYGPSIGPIVIETTPEIDRFIQEYVQWHSTRVSSVESLLSSIDANLYDLLVHIRNER